MSIKYQSKRVGSISARFATAIMAGLVLSCASLPSPDDAQENESVAMQIARHGAFNKGLKDVEVSSDMMRAYNGNATSRNVGTLLSAGAIAESAAGHGLGILNGDFGVGSFLVLELLSTSPSSSHNWLGAFVPIKMAATREEAEKVWKEYLRSAFLKVMPTTYSYKSDKQQVAGMKFNPWYENGWKVTGPGCAEADNCFLYPFANRALKAEAPPIMGGGDAWYVTGLYMSGLHGQKWPQLDYDLVYEKLASQLPKWAFYYRTYDTKSKPPKVPFVIFDGKYHYFIKEQRKAEQA